MDFEFSEELRLLADSVGRLMTDRYDFDARKSFAGLPEGYSPEIWRLYAELGLLGLPFAEGDGGIGGGPVETMVVMEAQGRALALEPYLATVVLGGGLIREGGNDLQRRSWLPRIGSGELRLAFACTEPSSRYNLADVTTAARRDGQDWVLDGAKAMVLHGDSADAAIVVARSGGHRLDRDGLTLFLVDADAVGLERRGYATIDGRRAADLVMTSVRVGSDRVIGVPDAALPIIELVVDQAIAALAAEAVGVMAAAHEATVEYLKTRVQFGSPIGKFQALQHRAVDMLIALEQARSMALYASMMADAGVDAEERSRAMAAVKVQIGRSARLVAQQAVQLHGGIGLTIEYKLGHYFQRLTAIDLLFGDAEHHLRRLAASGGLFAAEG
jgi:pimeloyl-CoA dehydrogenase small subunit